ncbi:MAG TPA: DEAD/DEAH box helicase [Candidatus Korarchaeota archaeon]|nr:DEAD/DEAH box helicase [Candidatus Korarchaeota archaeon]
MSGKDLIESFPDCLKLAIKNKGIKHLTEIQELAIPHVLQGEHSLLIAPTGSGKTEAALLPLLTRMLQEEGGKGFKLLYITPLRALNRDLEERVTYWSEACGFTVGVRHGDTSRSERVRQAESPPDILITTPETLSIILTGPKISKWLKNVRYVIIDEVHELLDDKRGTQLSLTLERLKRIAAEDFQIVLLSASLGNPELALEHFSYRRKGKIIVSKESRSMEISVIYPKVSKEDIRLSKSLLLEPEVVARVRLLADLIRNAVSAIVFTNTRSMAEALGYRMKKLFDELKIHVHHSSLSKDARVESETLLKKGELSAIISTSSLELGIDIGYVDVVVQYGSPRQATKLLQRVGRSGHGPGRTARGVVVAQDSDDYLESIVLARRALQGELEGIRPFEKSYDVLYHETIGLLIREGKVHLPDLVDMVRNSWPYRNLSLEETRELFSFMSKAWPRIVWYDELEDTVMRYGGGLAHEYFFSNISTIPDTASYPVIDETTGFYIGQLDETFVLEYLLPGVKFVFRGSVWRVDRIEGGRIYVEQVFDPVGAIPSWIGEQLPVPREVALEVGRIRGIVERAHRKGDLDSMVSQLLSTYRSAKREDLIRAFEPIIEHIEKGYPLPTDKRIVLERISGSGTVIHSTQGSLVNRTLGRTISYLISSEFKVGVRVSDDPYRIVIIGVSDEVVREAIDRLLRKDYRSTIIRAVENSAFFRIRLLHVAKRMGLVRDVASSRIISLSKLAKAYEGTPVYEEALRETITKDFDVESTENLLRDIRDGKVNIVVSSVEGPSPLSILGLERSGLPMEIIPPSELTRRLLESFKYRILSQQVTLVCADCWEWSMDTTISSLLDLGKVPDCPICGSKRIAAMTGYWAAEAKEYVEESRKKGRPSVGNWELANRAYEFGMLTERYGLPAIVAMAARGVDPIDVEWLLTKHSKIDEEFLSELAKTETEAIKRKLVSKKRRRRRKA